jgi:CubicO group peptidase (beta-lactamase class C family)
MRESKVPAVSVAVFEHYQLQWAHAWGFADLAGHVPATETTLFQAGSISKSGNALAVLEAVASGKLALDRPINDELVSWKLPENDLTRHTPVTLRQLLGHTAGTTVHGFPGYAAGEPLPTVQQILDGTPPANTPPIRVDLAPGTAWRYSGGGITITQLALTEALHQSYPEILARTVLEPLGMTHSTYEQPLPAARVGEAAAGYRPDGSEVEGKRHVYPEMAAAGLWTTPSDLSRMFAEIALARTGGSKVISKQIAMEMTTKSTAVPNATGLGIFLVEKAGAMLFGHNGADEGFQAYALASLDGGFGAVIMANSDNGHEIFEDLFAAIATAYHWPTLDPPIVRVALDAERRAGFVGWYHRSNSELIPVQLIDRAGTLELRFPFGKPHELVPIAADTVVDRSNGARLHLTANRALEIIAKPGVVGAFEPSGSDTPVLFALEAGQVDAAVAALRARHPGKPEHDALIDLAYDIMRDQPANAVLVLRFAADVFPTSANVQDSLGDAYRAAHDAAHAAIAYEQAIALVDADPLIPADDKARFRKHEAEELVKLKAR